MVKINAFLLMLGTRQGYPFFTISINIVLEILTRTFRQEKVIKDIQIEKQEAKLSLLMDDIIL